MTKRVVLKDVVIEFEQKGEKIWVAAIAGGRVHLVVASVENFQIHEALKEAGLFVSEVRVMEDNNPVRPVASGLFGGLRLPAQRAR